MACAKAKAFGKEYGMSFIDGCWYVGTRLQLDAIGVLCPVNPCAA